MKLASDSPRLLGITVAFVMAASGATALPIGWSAVGDAGTFTPNGVVSSLPEISTYYYVSTANGIDGVGALAGAGGDGIPTNGSTLISPVFSAAVGSSLGFKFNYVTSDDAIFADYAWAQVINVDDPSGSLLLFTARSTLGGDTVPGFSMPALAEGLTLDPPATPIIPGGPLWDQLGEDSGECWFTGCGYTGWINGTYEFTQAGNFRLQFGVTNWNDSFFHSGMAIAGTTIDGVPIAVIPLPAAGWLLLGGLGALAVVRRRRSAA